MWPPTASISSAIAAADRRFGALEGHVLQEVGDAVLLRGFVAGAGGDIGAEGDGLDPVHAFGDDGQAGGQAGELDGIAHGVWCPASGCKPAI